jgi:hypothetical protein
MPNLAQDHVKLEVVTEVWAWVQGSWGTIALLVGYLPIILSLYKTRLELDKVRLEIAKLQVEVAQRESRIERVGLVDIAKYAPKSSAFEDIR